MTISKVNSFRRKLTYSLQRLIFRRFMIATSEQFGLKLKFKSEDVVGRHIYKYDIHELEVTKILLEQVSFSKGDIMLDVGANIGWYSLLFGKQGATVHAFEPDPLNNQLLNENIVINELENSVTSHLMAISDQKSTMSLYLYPNINRGRHSLNPNSGSKKIDVQTTSLDDFLEENHIDATRVKLVKIDIEGHELPALRGAKKLLEHVPFLLVEHGPEHIRKGGYNPHEIIEILTSYNYIPYTIRVDGVKQASVLELYNEEDELNIFWRKEQ